MSSLKPRTIYCTGEYRRGIGLLHFQVICRNHFHFIRYLFFLNEIVHKIINPGTVFRYLPYLRTPDFFGIQSLDSIIIKSSNFMIA